MSSPTLLLVLLLDFLPLTSSSSISISISSSSSSSFSSLGLVSTTVSTPPPLMYVLVSHLHLLHLRCCCDHQIVGSGKDPVHTQAEKTIENRIVFQCSGNKLSSRCLNLRWLRSYCPSPSPGSLTWRRRWSFDHQQLFW